ncbi:hypothetical protein DES36_11940 [Alkalibaculum bacchi]|uniref:Antidote-toxin recognition antitoxin MazE n=1 Tax=Alkalibaculum bacchi TaxID=645887 RepID=A0A366I167_9FIRM|nr:AbrB/MazE/SpoVT family DNA-binding domain-containing protein [Alkalibaculum bacchi]RBP59315.1 hypothetical protein DES36_11940 [Alkalibaculum bacchi]
MEKRYVKLIATKGGSGSESFRVSLPTTWIRSMGLGKNARNLIISFDGKQIIIENNNQENK